MENDFDAIKALFESQARARQQKARGLGPQAITYEAEAPAARQPLVVPGMQFKRRSEQTAREKAAADVMQARPRVMAQTEAPDPLAQMAALNRGNQTKARNQAAMDVFEEALEGDLEEPEGQDPLARMPIKNMPLVARRPRRAAAEMEDLTIEGPKTMRESGGMPEADIPDVDMRKRS